MSDPRTGGGREPTPEEEREREIRERERLEKDKQSAERDQSAVRKNCFSTLSSPLHTSFLSSSLFLFSPPSPSFFLLIFFNTSTLSLLPAPPSPIQGTH